MTRATRELLPRPPGGPFRRLARKAAVGLRYVRARAILPRLRATAGTDGALLLGALDDALARRQSAAAGAWHARIERLRNELLARDEPLTRTLFGYPADWPEPRGEQVAAGRRVRQTIASVCRDASRQPLWCRFLFHLVATFRPRRALELGTSLGVTAAYQAAALHLAGGGRLATIEGDPGLARIAHDNLEGLGLGATARVVSGRFQHRLGDVARELAPIDWVFVDGGKYEDDTLANLARLAPHFAPRTLVVIDDIAWSPAMADSWRRYLASQATATTLDTSAMGACLVDRSASHGEHHEVAIG